MLLSNIGIDVTQEAITIAAGLTKIIEENGMRIDQMADAIAKLHLNAKLWYKEHASIDDIATLLDTYRYPVGVEWQGIFEEDEDTYDENSGHYSIVTRVDTDHNALIIVDPYKDFAAQDRIIGNTTFQKRWWDENEIPDATTGVIREIRDEELLFVVTPSSITFPPELVMLSSAQYSVGKINGR